MSRLPTTPLDREEAALAARYAKLPDALPPAELDQRIRQAAAAAVTRRSRFPWPTAIAAALALGIGVKVVMEPAPVPGMAERVSEMSAPVAEPARESATPASSAPGADVADRTDADAEAQASPATQAASEPMVDRIEVSGARIKQVPAESDGLPARQEAAADRVQAQPDRLRETLSNESPAPASAPSAASAADIAQPRQAPAAPATVQPLGATKPLPQPPPPAVMSAPAPTPEAFPAAPPAPPADAQAAQGIAPARDERRLRALEAAPVLDAAETKRDGSLPRQAESEQHKAAEALGGQAGMAKSRRAAGAAESQAESFESMVETARELLGRGDEAALRALLARIVERYPDRDLPDDLASWRTDDADPA